MNPNISLTPVNSKKDLDRFIQIPWSIYANDPNWIPPLILERRQILSPKNPYFIHAHWQGWIAWDGSRPVGRISAQIDRLYLQHQQRRTGFFGMLEAVDEITVFDRLFQEAENWLRQAGMKTVSGPFNLSINHECGLLVDGFDLPPVVMMPYNPPYYASHLKRIGYTPAKDLLAYLLNADTPPPKSAKNLAAKAARDILVRPLQRNRLKKEFELLRDIFNEAWAENWGFVPFTREEFAEMAKSLSHVIEDDFVQIAELNGKAVGMIVAVPDLNSLLSGLDGHLLPLNWLRLLWRWKTAYPDTGRVILMGIRRPFRDNLLGAAIASLLIEALREPVLSRGMRQMELSWILEDNHRIRGIIENMGARCYKRYRIYEKDL